jgi:hypothetical protein
MTTWENYKWIIDAWVQIQFLDLGLLNVCGSFHVAVLYDTPDRVVRVQNLNVTVDALQVYIISLIDSYSIHPSEGLWYNYMNFEAYVKVVAQTLMVLTISLVVYVWIKGRR